ncbi:hypothetical protein [Sphingomicrobium lutaoense]|uniref:Uncharacterized protein n=1 Tax=Sphingomicrobium lutaoense TaxID=515949 RepID=A0A839YZE4_9SPHN|nr:hypothetical protein [Sphingomicrobium lutaoense]MBB3763830.1 hypothetical protein [Sphingomicrobium lutaoense]
MTEHPIRFFKSDEEIRRLGEGLLACNLARSDWTHEAHLGATVYLLLNRPDVDLDRELPGLIRRFNESVGGVNDETQGYHDTITKAYLAGVRHFLATEGKGRSLTETVNRLLASNTGRRDFPLHFYSEARLMSVEARLGFIEPDRAPLPC